ncbi:hypothetical protein LCGC14_2278850 [marine sediment metagenome]|uniref:Uncharacterized protein n=1 Tax=marine sediment metagenome TaxID=412755 RepID=A0A0F9FPV2_9ZZZZ
MYLDNDLLLSDEQDIGAGGGTAVSTNTIDLTAARKIWHGRSIFLVFIIDETFLTSTSINFQVVTDTVEGLGSPTIQLETGAITIGSLTAGRIPIVLPLGSAIGTTERYMGARYVEAGSSSTAGKITAFVALDYTSNMVS